MARLLESDALAVLAEAGVLLPTWHVAESAEAAQDAAARLTGPVVVKALVPIGGRGKAGAVRMAFSPDEAAGVAADLLAGHVGAFPVKRVLVMERLEIVEEHFLSFTFDPSCKGPVMLFSREGGIELGGPGGASVDSLIRYAIDPLRGLRPFEARDVAVQAGLRGGLILQAGDLFGRVYQVFRACDARLVEINPLALTAEGRLCPAAAVIDLDDQALFRHPDLRARLSDEEGTGLRPFTPLERRIREIDQSDPDGGAIRFLEFPDGDIGFMVTSGGAALTVLDRLIALGGRPANAFDMTTGPSVEAKIYLAARAILGRPGIRGLIAGGNVKNLAQVDVQVRGIVRAVRDAGVDPRRFPIVLRFAGPGVEGAREVAASLPGLEFYEDETSLETAVRRLLERMREPIAP